MSQQLPLSDHSTTAKGTTQLTAKKQHAVNLQYFSVKLSFTNLSPHCRLNVNHVLVFGYSCIHESLRVAIGEGLSLAHLQGREDIAARDGRTGKWCRGTL